MLSLIPLLLKYLVIVLYLQRSVKGMLSLYLTEGPLLLNLTSINPQGGNIISVTNQNNTTSVQFLISESPNPSNSTVVDPSWFGPTFNTSFKIKSWTLNSNTSKNSRFLLFDSEFILQILDFNSIIPLKLKLCDITLNTTIVDAIYGATSSQIYVLILNKTLPKTLGLFYLLDLNIATYTQNFLVQSSNYIYSKMVYKNNLLIMLFTTFIEIKSANLSNLYRFGISTGGTVQNIDIDITNNNFLVFANNAQVDFYNLSQIDPLSITLPLQSNLKFTTNQFPFLYTGIKVISECFIIVSFTNFIIQYNYHTNQVLDTLYFPNFIGQFSNKYQVEMLLSPQTIVAYVRNNQSNVYYIIGIDDSYTCIGVCSTCNTGYQLNNQGYCWKNPNDSCMEPLPFVNNTFNDPSTTNDSSSNSTNQLNSSNSSNSSNSNSCTNYLCYFYSLNNNTIKMISIAVANSFTFCSIRLTPNFLLSLTNFIDDLWLYSYHRKNRPQNYPTTVTYFLQQSSLIGQFRVNPSFTRIIDIFNQSYIGNEQNNYTIQYLNLHRDTDIDQVYFFNATEDVFKVSMPITILLFILAKIAIIVFSLIRKKYKVGKMITKQLKNSSKWWSLITGGIQINMIRLSYSCSLQLHSNYFLSPFDKVNYILMILIHFCLIWYSLNFYLLVYTYQKKGPAEVLLTKTKYSFSSFLLQPALIVTRNLVRSFVHGFALFEYSTQISILLVLDLVSILIILRMRKLFQSKVVFAITLTYNLTLAAFDCFFMLEENYFQNELTLHRELFGFICILSLIGFAILLSLYLLLSACYCLAKFLAKKIFKQNKNKIFESPFLKSHSNLGNNLYEITNIPKTTKQLPQKPSIKQVRIHFKSKKTINLKLSNMEKTQNKLISTNRKRQKRNNDLIVQYNID